MALKGLYGDRVDLVKSDGTVAKTDLLAVVGKGTIQLHDATAPIEVSDHLLRKIPNGMVENYTVIDATLHSGLGMSYYEVDVRKGSAGAQPQQAAIQQITNIFHGANARANINSIDNSTNVASSIDVEKIRDFAAQVRANKPSLPTDVQEKIGGPLSALEREAHAAAPNPAKLIETLKSVKTIAEGAAGNLVASGIASLATSLM